MTTSNFATYPQTNTADSYAGNLGRAALNFLTALLAVKLPKSDAVAVQKEAVISEGSVTTAELRKLYRLAAGRDSVLPDVSVALKAIAEKN
jgi:hypothetical protein